MAINLQKGQKVNLKKASTKGLGQILVNLNWNSTPVNRGFWASLFGGNSGIDLDLGCLYELKCEKEYFEKTIPDLVKAYAKFEI